MSFFNKLKGGFNATVDTNKDGKRSLWEYGKFGLGALFAPTMTAARVGYNTSRYQPSQLNPYQRQNFGLTAQQPQNPQGAPQDFQQNINYGMQGLPGYQPQQPFRAPQQFPQSGNLSQMAMMNPSLCSGSAYQDIGNNYMNAKPSNYNGYGIDNASSVGGHWVDGAGWRTDANRAMGQTAEDMAFNAQMARQLANKSQ